MQIVAGNPINTLIDELQYKIIHQIAIRSANCSLSAIVSTKALQDIADRLTKINKILNVQRYNLVFIGQVGAGKTTAICHLFNLVREVEDTRLKGLREIKIKKTKELLSTGAGKTTICEVVIRPSRQTWIEIEPYQLNELQLLIEEFGLWIWQKTHPEVEKKRVEIPPDELLRAIRNILNLPETVINGKLNDLALQFADDFTIDQYSVFKQALLDRGKLVERVQTEIHPPEIDQDIKIWLNGVFRDLNVANLAKFSIPKRIYLNLSDEFLDFKKHPRFGSIVDTRGLDLATKDRRDLAHYIRDTDSSICIFTERFPSAPSNVIQIIGKYLTPTSKDIDTKFALLVMPRKGEPEKVLGADGQSVDNFEEGIELRKANIDNVFTNENINFYPQNILFYDALQCYLGDGSLDLNYEISDIEIDRERMFAEIDQLIIDREQQLIAEIDVLSEQIQQIQSGNNLTRIEDALVIDAAKKISSLGNLDLDDRLFLSEYIDMLPKHHSTLRATNNRYGKYELRGIDIYFNGRYLAERLIRQSTKIAKIEMANIISSVEAEISADSTLYPLMQRLGSQIDLNYESMSIDLGDQIEAILTDKIFAPQDYTDCIFWQNVIDRWGQGSGYKSDVLLYYQEQLESIDCAFNQLIQAAWRDRVLQNALTFLGETKSMVI